MSRRSRVVRGRDGFGPDYRLDAVRADDDVSFDRLAGSEGDEAGSGVLHVAPYGDDIAKPNQNERSTFDPKISDRKHADRRSEMGIQTEYSPDPPPAH